MYAFGENSPEDAIQSVRSRWRGEQSFQQRRFPWFMDERLLPAACLWNLPQMRRGRMEDEMTHSIDATDFMTCAGQPPVDNVLCLGQEICSGSPQGFSGERR